MRRVPVRCGLAGLVRCGIVGRVLARLGSAGMVWRSKAWRGLAWQGRYGYTKLERSNYGLQLERSVEN